MAGKPSVSPHDGLSRRGLLGVGVALPVAAALPVKAQAQSPAPPGPSDGMPGMAHDALLEALECLTTAEMEALEAVCARLVPSDETGPGAKEARAAHYIDRALAGALAHHRGAYAAGLSALDSHARASRGKPFAELPPADQDGVLREVEANRAPGFAHGSAAFFALVRGHTLEGMFCDPYYGGNARFIGWDLIGYPGLRMQVTAEDQRFAKPAILRESAYGAGLYGREGGQ